MNTPNETAYPINFSSSERSHGLTKRELFAAMVMQVSLANPHTDCSHRTLAEDSVKAADALIEALNKPTA